MVAERSGRVLNLDLTGSSLGMVKFGLETPSMAEKFLTAEPLRAASASESGLEHPPSRSQAGILPKEFRNRSQYDGHHAKKPLSKVA